MATSKEYLEYVLELLKEVKLVTYKKMMGEYILYKDKIIFGGVYDNRFLIKKTKSNEEYGYKEVIPYPNAKAMYLVESEDPEEVFEIVMRAFKDILKTISRLDLEHASDEEVKKLADSGNFSGIFEYGIRMYNQDKYQDSYDYLIKLINSDNFIVWERIISLAYHYLPGVMSDEDLFKLLLRRHNRGSSYYSYILAYFYRDGRGCKKDLHKYIELLDICSNDGSMYATYELAECYEKGFGVRKSLKKAFEVYYNWVDDHGRRDYWCEYKVAYYMLHELGGAKKDMGAIEYHLRYACKVHREARELYKELFNKEWDAE